MIRDRVRIKQQFDDHITGLPANCSSNSDTPLIMILPHRAGIIKAPCNSKINVKTSIPCAGTVEL